jgi:hypothetical protein
MGERGLYSGRVGVRRDHGGAGIVRDHGTCYPPEYATGIAPPSTRRVYAAPSSATGPPRGEGNALARGGGLAPYAMDALHFWR